MMEGGLFKLLLFCIQKEFQLFDLRSKLFPSIFVCMRVSVKAVVSTPFSLSHFVAPSAHISSTRDLNKKRRCTSAIEDAKSKK